MTGAEPPFDVLRLGIWWWRLRRSAVRIAGLADDRSAHLKSASHLLGNIVKGEDLVAVLGGPAAKLELPSLGHSPYTEWLEMVWGRRCSYYLAKLADGLLESTRVLEDEDIPATAKRIETSSETLSNEFRRVQRDTDTLEKALPFSISPFLITYLDATLFSSLMLLKRASNPESPSYKALQIRDREKARAGLLHLIREEAALYVGDGVKSDVLMDDSTLWWAIAELLNEDGDRFALGSYQGMDDAVELCNKLAIDRLIAPSFGMAASEITAEIHRPLRTKLLIIQNVLRILRMKNGKVPIWTDEQFQRLRGPLTKLAAALFDEVRLYPYSNPKAGEEEEHAYFSGLGLETASQCFTYLMESIGVKIGPEGIEALDETDDKEWSLWAPSTRHARALGYKDYRMFERQLRANDGFREHPINRQLSKFKFSKVKAGRLKRYHDAL